jgi:acetyl-CoA C-acetyltransferase
MTRRVAIVGAYEYPHRVAPPGMSALQIKAECASRALVDAGLGWDAVDSVCDASETQPLAGLSMAEYFGMRATHIEATDVGGSAYELQVAHVADAVASGRVDVAVLTYGSTARSDRRQIGTGNRALSVATPAGNMEDHYGMPLVGNYALVARRHMHDYGTTSEQLAEIAVTARAHALANPAAVQGMQDVGYRDIGPLTIDDVVGSRLVADPLHRWDCCMITDGGGAIVLAAEDIAATLEREPVWVLGCGEGIGYLDNGGDITVSAMAGSGSRAFAQAGVRPDDVDVVMTYDSFTITVLVALEDLGFCAKGEGGALVEGGALTVGGGGGFALNTDGGGLSSNHPGRRGLFLLIEAVRQLRGESTAQVPDATIALANGVGGYLGTRHVAGTVLLGKG